jgi:hypothetical protein
MMPPEVASVLDDCRVCGTTHDPEVQAAVERVRQWQREQIGGLRDPCEVANEKPPEAGRRSPSSPIRCSTPMTPRRTSRRLRVAAHGQRNAAVPPVPPP